MCDPENDMIKPTEEALTEEELRLELRRLRQENFEMQMSFYGTFKSRLERLDDLCKLGQQLCIALDALTDIAELTDPDGKCAHYTANAALDAIADLEKKEEATK